MAHTFHLRVLTPVLPYYDGPCESLVVPAADGYLGILAGHAPLMAQLTTGTLTIKTPTETRHEVIFGGVVEVTPEGVLVLSQGGTCCEAMTPAEIEHHIAALHAQAKVILPETREWDYQQVALDRMMHELQKARRAGG